MDLHVIGKLEASHRCGAGMKYLRSNKKIAYENAETDRL